MAARAYWKGYLKLSLVSCPVAMFPASSTSSRIIFHTINRETGNRIRQQIVDAETGEAVEPEDRAKGYEVGRGQYILVDDDDLESIALESTHTIDIEHFAPRAEIDERYLDTPYYLVPDDRVAQEAFAVIREAMRDKDMVGVGRVVLHRRERIVMLEPLGKGMLATTLRYGTEIRDHTPYFEDIPDIAVPKEMRDLAAHIITTKAGRFEPARFEDRYETALASLVRSKQAGAPTPTAERPEPPRVVNLMEALRRSLAAEAGSAAPVAAKKASKTRKKGETKPERPPARKTALHLVDAKLKKTG